MDQLSLHKKKKSYSEGDSKKGHRRREGLIVAARDLFEEKGLSKTSVLDITERVGVTRSLYYHYFRDKDEITSAVLETYAADFIEAMQHWNEQRVPGETEKSLRSLLQIFRSGIFENNPFRVDLASTENASLYLQFVSQVADSISTFLIENAVDEYAAMYPVEIDYIYESIYALIIGLIGLIRLNPDVSQEIVFRLTVQTLHLEAGMKGTC